jgi:hypothetical protein
MTVGCAERPGKQLTGMDRIGRIKRESMKAYI